MRSQPTPALSLATRRDAPPAFHIMVKPRGAICNLACDYCYFLSKERLYPNSTFRMPIELLEAFTRQYIEAQHVPEVTFGWQGGEPTLMGLDFFRRAVELQEKYRKPGMRIINALQTNGTTLDDEWCRFLHEHDFLIGISLDGPRELHDAYRHDKGGHSVFDRVMRGVELMKKHGVEFNILCTVHAANAEHPLEVYRFFRDEVGAQFIQFIPIVERDNDTGFQEGDKVTERSVTGKQYGEFLIAIFDEWVRRDVGRVFVQIFDVSLAAWSGLRPGLCVFEETCGLALVMEHNGDLYACDHFVEPRYKLGNIQETPLLDMVTSEKQRKFGLDKRDALPRYCRECAVRFVCNGGCPKNRLLRTPDGEPGLNYLCEGYKAFFTHIDRPMRIMAAELKAGRPPANIMRLLAEEEAELQRRFARARRNDPCPCGSGLKFKYCHGRKRTQGTRKRMGDS
ncbi:MAG TPA: anaerobic sulfatase maturase [Caldilineae bacterium]|nr:anaerobic sulfatase maturase [Caldilineae bacterium]